MNANSSNLCCSRINCIHVFSVFLPGFELGHPSLGIPFPHLERNTMNGYPFPSHKNTERTKECITLNSMNKYNFPITY